MVLLQTATSNTKQTHSMRILFGSLAAPRASLKMRLDSFCSAQPSINSFYQDNYYVGANDNNILDSGGFEAANQVRYLLEYENLNMSVVVSERACEITIHGYIHY